MNTTGILFLHGAGLSTHIWKDVERSIQYPVLLAEYPHVNGAQSAQNKLTLEDYADHVMQQIATWNVDGVVVVAHSIGGTLALKVAEGLGEKLRGFIAIGAVIPKHGGSYVSALPFPNRMIISAIMRLAGTKPPESAIRKTLCNGLSKEQTDEVVAQSVAESVHLYFDKTNAEIPTVPRLYIRLTQDKELPVSWQNTMAQNLDAEVQDIDFGHMPMLGKPQDVARVVNAFTGSLG